MTDVDKGKGENKSALQACASSKERKKAVPTGIVRVTPSSLAAFKLSLPAVRCALQLRRHSFGTESNRLSDSSGSTPDISNRGLNKRPSCHCLGLSSRRDHTLPDVWSAFLVFPLKLAIFPLQIVSLDPSITRLTLLLLAYSP